MTARSFRQSVKWGLEAAALGLAFGLFRLLPVDAASALGGRLGRAIGPRSGVHRVGRRNLAAALPELDEARREAVLRGMWDNLGRVIAEVPHLDKMGDPARLEVVGAEHVAPIQDGGPSIFASGHLANWEVLGPAAAKHGIVLDVVYRAANNPWLGWLYDRRRPHPESRLIPKGSEGARQALKALREGRHLGLLVDQKMNDGIELPFFGRPAMTAPATAQMALRFKCPVLPVQVERLNGARFRVTVHPPLDLPDSGDRETDARQMMTRLNHLLETWIRQHPEQWLWVHRRWKD
ncbi:lysophospholipid acyltransferase family protein [Roseospirillum parvum]|uniref:KDO2-lipid IV(A) lauroyltransferase n=1 Tax=Roseospirillum parvum TaxID=83401 RepID=A0A1G7UKB9_9PROT|nr:lauroyl acyltransferase [Roseospirillum parvum]SDG48012.1 KDO2-lipid IV(A) lauroyltransferase [Roseospirillum parvum]